VSKEGDLPQLELQNINEEGKEQVDLEVAGYVPPPVEAAFVGDQVASLDVHRHGEHPPPLLFATLEVFLVGEPPWASTQVGADEPAEEEHSIVDWSQAEEATNKQPCVVPGPELALPFGMDVFSDLDVGEECSQHEELIEP